MRGVLLTAVLLGPVLPAGGLGAQDLLPELRTADPANAAAWLKPLAGGIASGLTSGFFTSGGRGKAFSLGIRYTVSPFSGDDEAYSPRLPERVFFEGQVYPFPYEIADDRASSPTVAGSGRGAVLAPRGAYRAALVSSRQDPDAKRIFLPSGLGLSAARIPVLEAGIALRGLGLHLVGRFFPTVALDPELGHVRAFGGGALVTVSRFVGVDVIDVGVAAAGQKMDAGDYLDASASALAVVVSRSLGPVRAYATGTVVSSRVEVRYTMENPDGVAALPPDGSEQALRYTLDGRLRGAMGLVLSTEKLRLSAEYSPGSRDVVSLGFGVGGG